MKRCDGMPGNMTRVKGRQKGLWLRYWKQTLNYVPKICLTSTFVPKDYVTH